MTATPISPAVFQSLVESGRSLLAKWETAWPGFEGELETAGLRVLCEPGCVPCCYARRVASLPEAALIVDYLRREFSAEAQEEMRLRVDSTVSSLRRLRADGCCGADESFFRAGGLECPFLEKGRCQIYPVRPVECRAMIATAGDSTSDCRRCSVTAPCASAGRLLADLRREASFEEARLGLAAAPEAEPPLLAEALRDLWDRGAPASSVLFTAAALEDRWSSSNGPLDQTWQDDRHDYQSLFVSLTLPPEGDHPGGLTLLRQDLEVHEIYDWFPIVAPSMRESCTLYKRNPDCDFDWESREFRSTEAGAEPPYTVWMSDGPQERLMMWEAAKRARGTVLCGGLGLGIFPQFALSLGRVTAVHVIELDPDVVRLVKDGWARQPWAGVERCTITEARVEEFLSTTRERYDTVYVDTWDAIYHEYLPHLNELGHRAARIVKPGGEVLLWARDLMVRHFLRSARLVVERREKYVRATASQMAEIARLYPLLHTLVCWLKEHPNGTDEALLTEAHALATRERRDLGLLTLARQPGAADLLRRKYANPRSSG